MTRTIKYFWGIFTAAALCGGLLASCDEGLAPPPTMGFIAGTVHFGGTWPAKDSVKNLILVLVPNDPTYHIPDLIAGVTSNKILYKVLNYKSSDTTFRFDLDSGHYGYLGVAERFSDSIFRDWRSVGFAHDAHDSALKFDPRLGVSYSNIQVSVNFDSLPWQPFVP